MVSFYTFGCKLNQLETEAIAASFRNAGFTVLPWFLPAQKEKHQLNGTAIPELCIINTCTVTSKAEQKARRIIRLCLSYGCIVLVSGCYAQMEREELAALGDKLFILPGQLKDKLLDLPGCLAETDIKQLSSKQLSSKQLSLEISRWCHNISDSQPDPHDVFRFNPQHFLYHSRAFLKIQDGCDRSCAYCRVPLARGKSISLSSKEALCRLQALEKNGMAEAVITGVNICQYRDPDKPAITLPALLQYLLDNTSTIALRLSSIEPEFLSKRLDSDFFSVLAHPRIRNHFHLSVQSGSDTILATMKRPYQAKDVLYAAEKLRSIRDDPFLACDIICGFPGETDGEFTKTLTLCQNIDFAWIHAFPYSKRPGTSAASIRKGLVNQSTAGRRVQKLLKIARQGKSAYMLRWQGKTVEAVAESVSADAAPKPLPFFPALTENYIKIAVLDKEDKRPKPGTSFSCIVQRSCTLGKKQENNALPDNFDAWGELV